MADDAKDKGPAPTPARESEGQRINRELAEAAQEAEARSADEFPEKDGVQVPSPDGRGTVTAYGKFLVDGVLVGPDGKPIDGKK
jgi:hypothetical protein